MILSPPLFIQTSEKRHTAVLLTLVIIHLTLLKESSCREILLLLVFKKFAAGIMP